MKNIEIPYEKDRSRRYRFYEILPGALSWSFLALPIVLSLINATLAAGFIIAFLLVNFVRAIGISIRALQGHKLVETHKKTDWLQLLHEVQDGEIAPHIKKRPKWHYENIARLATKPCVVRPEDILHVAMIAEYKESREVLEPTIQAVIDSAYDLKKIILVVAYEERGGEQTKQMVNDLVKEYGHHFYHAEAIEHPAGIPDELIGKGANITYAGRKVQEYVAAQKIDPLSVVVTTLDADNRPHKQYFAALSYVYSLSLDPLHTSYQPVSIYTNNIWDAPAPMRVIATGNTYWNTVLTMRPHMLRNFSAHAQSLASLIDTDFWSVRTIVEDGHQFWRTYFRYDGKHVVYPIYVPIYQDAVLSETYVKTLRAQFVQLRRWTWGASDIAYFIDKGFYSKNKVPKIDKWMKLGRLVEGHVTWAVMPPLLAFAAFVPVLFNPDNYAANELPLVVSRIQQLALAGAIVSIYICFKTLPPKPVRYKHHRTLFMLLQWAYMPFTSLIYSSVAAFNSQTRLMFKKYLEFDVTPKAVVTDDAEGKTSKKL
jgi:hypothetical protein